MDYEGEQAGDPKDEVSLEELSLAFAQAMGAPSKSEAASEPSSSEASAAGSAPNRSPSVPPDSLDSDDLSLHPADDDPCEISPSTILEAMLFVGAPGGEPLTAARAAELMRGVDPGEIADLVREMNRRYAAAGRPYEILSEGAGYRLSLRPDFHGLRARFYGRTREARLSQAAVDVLAIVAYRQPITVEELTRLREMPSGHLVTQLVRRKLLRLERTAEKPRKTLFYTTDRFLELFGLESLSDLPQTEDSSM